MSKATNRMSSMLLGGITLMSAAGTPLHAEPALWSTPGRSLADDSSLVIGGRQMGEALGDVLESVELLESVSGVYGLYADGPCLLAGTLAQGQSASFTFELEAGETYAFVGGADSSVDDLDLMVRDQRTGTILASDRDADDYPYVTITPSSTGRYSIEVLNYSGSGTGCVTLAVLRKGAPAGRAEFGAEAAERFLDAADAVAYEWGTARILTTPGEWSLYGSILAPGQSVRVWGIDLEPGTYAFMTVGDFGVLDADLTVFRDNMPIGADTTNGPLGLVPYRAWGRGVYTIEYQNYLATGPGFVITGILDL